MKRFALYIGMAAVLVASCSIKEKNFDVLQQDDVVFYASFEQPSEGTRVYANEDLLLRWTADDRVSIFNKLTYNQQYKFTGNTGDNAGGFRKVDADEFVTGNPISHIVSVYPFQEETKISENEVLTLTLPAEQHYAENTFGLGDNTMISVSSDNVLQYKNVGGYIRVSLYGKGELVSSVTLMGNNGERLAGKASVTMPLDGIPTIEMAEDAKATITLNCETPISLGAKEEECVDFWFVVPPVSFDRGLTITVKGEGGSYTKSTDKALSIERSKVSKMSAIKVELSEPKNVIYYTSIDGKVVTPTVSDYFGAVIISNTYVDGQGIIVFDRDVPQIGNFAFRNCATLSSITLPSSINRIGNQAFYKCFNLKSFEIPENVESIGQFAFSGCEGLSSIVIPGKVTSVGMDAFSDCLNLSNISIASSVKTIEYGAFSGCTSLTSITIPNSVTSFAGAVFYGCTNLKNVILPESLQVIDNSTFMLCRSLTTISIPNSVLRIGVEAFSVCSNLTNIIIPDNVTNIGSDAFFGCSKLTSISLPEGLTSIEPRTFQSCLGLTSVIIPESVLKIGERAFSGCTSLTRITIPQNVTSIGDNAFEDFPNAIRFVVLPNTPPTGGEHMFNATNDAPIFVQEESVNAYKTVDGWKEYADRIFPLLATPQAVDLGLSVKWASFNLGAKRPEEIGRYYAWGEIDIKDRYNWSTYRWGNSSTSLDKYNTNSVYGKVDYLTQLELQDDAARFSLDEGWRIPTKEEFDELLSNCTIVFTRQNDVVGFLFTSEKNGNNVFFPSTDFNCDPPDGYYWSSSLNDSTCSSAWRLDLNVGHMALGCSVRCYSNVIRPVTK